MIGWIYVMEPQDYQKLAERRRGRRARWRENGEKLFQSLACANCHKLDGTGRCPILAGLFGKTVQLAGGGTVKVDEAYIRESILQPQAKVVAGYQPIMPTFQGQVTEEGVLQLVEYIKSLGPETGRTPVSPLRRLPGQSARETLEHMITAAAQEREHYLNASYGIKSWLLTKDHKRIGAAVSAHHHAVLLPGRRVRHPDPRRTADAAGRPGLVGDLQQAVHHARRHDGVLLPDPVDSRDAGQFLPADDDRRARPGVPQHQPAELVPAGGRRPVQRCSPCSPAASIPAGPSTRRTAPLTRTAR